MKYLIFNHITNLCKLVGYRNLQFVSSCKTCSIKWYYLYSLQGFFENLDQFVTSWYLDPILWFALIGVIIFVMATLGCIGALRENTCLLKTYITVLCLMLILEIGGGVALYIFRGQIEEFVANRIDDVAITNYRDNADFQDIIDGFQTGLKCCGVNGYDDWNMNVYFNCTTLVGRYNPEACAVPFSCCVPDPADTTDVINTQCGYGVRAEDQRRSLSDQIYEQGCISAVKAWLSTNVVVVAVSAGAILLVQILGFGFATSLNSDIRRQIASSASSARPP
ncbi:tetraspanin-14-like [Strongylocentrotus purpuratus]|uniref:Tetraspanin-15 n=1 Tax=Strongylocentrotus purpuratus TaxID=7668 RepID=A0A7M7NI51_STRPU|nr:tetraspanin-14-like [Strongylocentrotus purpuratus]